MRDVVDAAPKASAAERASSLIGALPAIGLGVVVVVGIRFGVVTVTEASALAVAYALVDLPRAAQPERPARVLAALRKHRDGDGRDRPADRRLRALRLPAGASTASPTRWPGW